MRTRTIWTACLLGVMGLVGGMGCSLSDEASRHEAGAGGDWGSGGGWNGGGSGGGYGAPAQSSDPPVPPKPDPVTCDGLDMSKPAVLYLSADDSNSMGSPAQARELLRQGYAPKLIRTYEFLNYYRINYPAPDAPNLAIFAEAANSANPGEIDLQLGIRSFDAVKPRRPMTITFVLDTSGSMEGSPMERQIAAVKAVAESLAEGDIVSLVTWNTDNKVLLNAHSVNGPNDPSLLAAADQLEAGGGTDLQGGLAKGYQIAKQNYGAARLNRVILISDGGANVGITDENLIGDNSQDADKEGIYLVGVGVGPVEGYNDQLMDIVTDRGRGAYVYLDELKEASRVFVDRFDETMEVAARGVQVELTLPWYFQVEKFSGEEYSENPEEVEPQHLAPSDALVFNQVLKACDPSVINLGDVVKVKVTWNTPLTYEAKETNIETTVGDLLAADKPHLAKGKAIVAYAEALKAPTKETLDAALALVAAANASGTDPELTEIAELLKLHPQY